MYNVVIVEIAQRHQAFIIIFCICYVQHHIVTASQLKYHKKLQVTLLSGAWIFVFIANLPYCNFWHCTMIIENTASNFLNYFQYIVHQPHYGMSSQLKYHKKRPVTLLFGAWMLFFIELPKSDARNVQIQQAFYNDLQYLFH